MSLDPPNHWVTLKQHIKRWGAELGFQQVGIANIDLKKHKVALQNWLDKGYHGEMAFMSQNQEKRIAPDKLHLGTLRVITVRLDYLPENAQFAANLKDKRRAYISRYATGRDYHKVVRNKLKSSVKKYQNKCPRQNGAPFQTRPLARTCTCRKRRNWLDRKA